MNAAVILDRDGVLVRDSGLIISAEDLEILPGVPDALNRLKTAGYRLVVFSNQTVVARGLLSEEGVVALHEQLDRMLVRAGAPALDGWFFCPHHPNATLPLYRVNCECRKPRPGLLLQASRQLSLDLTRSVVVGDRITDVIAGFRAGCRTVLVQTGKHTEPPIETPDPLDETAQPDYICADLAAAADWVLRNK